MKTLCYAIFIALLSSCSLINDEASIDEKFVGSWKLISTKQDISPELLKLIVGQGICEINKVPNTKETYSMILEFPIKGMVVLNKKDSNTLESEGSAMICRISHHDENKATLQFGNSGADQMQFELEKFK